MKTMRRGDGETRREESDAEACVRVICEEVANLMKRFGVGEISIRKLKNGKYRWHAEPVKKTSSKRRLA